MAYFVSPGWTRNEPCVKCGHRVMRFEVVMAEDKEEACPIGVRCLACAAFMPLRLGQGKSG